MKILVSIFGGLICLAGVVLLVFPARFREFMNKWTGRPRFLFAIIVRIVFGAILLAEAPNLRFPLVMQIIGGISIAAAIGILLIGQERIDRFVAWWMRMSDNVLRAWSVAVLAFGAFLVYVTV